MLADADVDRIEMPQVDISSSMIRERVAAGRPIRHLVPDPVRELIEAEGLVRLVVGVGMSSEGPVVRWRQ